MNQEAFEAKVLELWITTRVPFTRANLQFATGAPRKKLEPWLKQLVLDGVLDADVDDAGEFVYVLRGAERPRPGVGPESPAELDRLSRLSREVRAGAGVGAGASAAAAMATSTALALRRELGGGADGRGALVRSETEPRKSLVASGILSFFFGPLGWLYAGHWREAIPAAGICMLLWMIVPKMLLMPVLGLVGPVSAAVGVAYAWKYNKRGQREKILPDEPNRLTPRK